MQFVIIAHTQDETAGLVCQALRRRHGPRHTVQLAEADLLCTGLWTQHIDAPLPQTTLRLPGGQRLENDGIGAVLNRLNTVTAPMWSLAAQVTREYAIMESHAFLLSWLASLGPRVINVPTPLGLAGGDRHFLEWLHLAARAGLPTVRATFKSTPATISRPGGKASSMVGVRSQTTAPDEGPAGATPDVANPHLLLEPLCEDRARALVAGDQLLGQVPEGCQEACLRLAKLAGCSLLELHFVRTGRPSSPGAPPEGAAVMDANGKPLPADTPTAESYCEPEQSWKFYGAVPVPRLNHPQAIGAIVALLERVAREGAPS